MKQSLVIITGVVVAVFALLGYMNAADVKRCVESGNSWEVCDRAFNR